MEYQHLISSFIYIYIKNLISLAYLINKKKSNYFLASVDDLTNLN
jgi:hypothetical protein